MRNSVLGGPMSSQGTPWLEPGIPGGGSGLEFHGAADALRDRFGETLVEIVAVAIVDPAGRGVVEVVVPGASARGKPNLIGGGLPAQDELTAVGKHHADEAIA